MLLELVGAPLAAAAVAAGVPSNARRPWVLPLAGLAHLALTVRALTHAPGVELGGWLALDPLGRLILGFISLLFFLCSFYAVGYLGHRLERPNRLFCAAFCAFLGMMSLIIVSHHLGLLWVAMEASTLTTAPLLYFNRTPRSLEATWKYLLIGSVGIALALFGTFFLAYAALHGGLRSTLFFEDLVRDATHLSRPWLHGAFILLFVGYGTKMGLAPLHTWKPDAYGEAPGVVGCLLAGGLTNCAFLAVARIYQVVCAAGEGPWARSLLVPMGLLSMATAAVFMARQRDLKRMLAYSSVEHMGILILGLGLGGAGVYGALFHLINNGLTKGVLFLAVGNIHRAYEGKTTDTVSGVFRRLPLTGALFLAGFFAITSSPPFAPFQSVFTLLTAAIGTGAYVTAALFVLALNFVFFGMASTTVAALQGEPSESARATPYRDGWLTGAPPLVFALLMLALGVHLPAELEAALRAAAAFLEPRP
ncbi:MAG: hydrogenase [Planctomycetes bacterium]|nr:hydrogenase [Planctomycetota bacterium]